MNPRFLSTVRAAVEQSSRSAVAAEIGVDPSDLGKYLAGSKVPSLPTQAKIVAWVDDRQPANDGPAEAGDEPNRVERLSAAQAEKRSQDEWVKGGREGDRPATPNLDAIQSDHDDGVKPKRTRKATDTPRRRAVADGIRFYHDDKPMPDSQNKLSSVAYYFTKGIDGKARLKTGELVDVLASKGVADPASSAWEVQLPNGVTLKATV